ncbi:hypothetical protein JCM11491_006351 [Sporobolomyces phaffii]
MASTASNTSNQVPPSTNGHDSSSSPKPDLSKPPPASNASSPPAPSAPVPASSSSSRARHMNGSWRNRDDHKRVSSQGARTEKGQKCDGDNKEGARPEPEAPQARKGPQPLATGRKDQPANSLPRPYSSVVAADSSTPRSVQFPSLRPDPAPSSVGNESSESSDLLSKRNLALDTDYLLGPRRRITQTAPPAPSSSGPSQPASTHSDDGHQPVEEPKLEGLGLSTGDGSLEGEFGNADSDALNKPGTFKDGYFDDGEDTDESWLHYSSSSRRGGDHHEGTSSTSHHNSSSNTSNSPPSQVASPPNPSNNSFGSPLSPHVPPFSPGFMDLNGNGNGTTSQISPHPWATPSAVISGSSRIVAAREREASWASVGSDSRGPYPSPSLRATFGGTVASATDSHPSSIASYSPFTSPPTSVHNHDSQPNASPAFPHPSNMPFTPPSSHVESFDAQSKDSNRFIRARSTTSASLPQPLTASFTGGGGGENVSTPTISDDITTVFVFGFPEDMMEREFQNLFLFARGFEGAILKLPHANGANAAGGEGTEAATPGGGGRTGHRGSIDDYDLKSPTVKKTKIGFAKFSTRQFALEAMDVLNRRPIDIEKGFTLKADIARKDFHIRRSFCEFGFPSLVPPHAMQNPNPTVEEYSVASSVSSLSNNSAYPPLPHPPATSSSTSSSDSLTVAALSGTGPSIPLSALDSDALQSLANSGNVPPAVLAEIARQGLASGTPTGSSATSNGRSAYEAFHSVPSVTVPSTRQAHLSDENKQQPSPALSQDSTRFPSTRSSFSSLSHQSSVLPSASQQDSTLYRRPSTSVLESSYAKSSPYLSNDSGYDPASTAIPRDQQVPFPPQLANPVRKSLPYGTYGSQLVPAVVRPQTQAQQQASAQVVQQQAQLAAAQAYARNVNPADMNAPKNTLYVGGLPAILPSLTGPFSASHLEDSLRNAFSRCPGYKRLQFRSKSNGPIVFVEFEDTAYATRAMNEMYGYTLGGLVKGGIRLSYSKNPLGVRSNGLPSGNPPLLPGTIITTTQIDPSLHGVVYPAYAVSYATASPALVEPLRRHPDPFYGAPTYPTSGHPQATTTSNHGSAFSTSASYTPVDQHHPRTSSVSAIGTPSQSTSSYGPSTTNPTPQTPFNSTFSPFSAAEY